MSAQKTQSLSHYDFGFIAGLIGLAPMLYLHTLNLLNKPHFQFFPLAWGLFGWLVYSRGNPGETHSKFRALVGWSLWGCYLFAAVFSIAKDSPWMSHVALILLCAGWTQLRLTGNAWYQVLGWLSLLLITLPLPGNLDHSLIQSLQTWSSQSASSLLDICGIAHYATGNVIEIKSQQLFVDEACSGVDSLYALGAVSLAIVLLQSRNLLPSLIVVLTVPLWAWLGNLSRIFLIAVTLDQFDIDLTHGLKHTVLGLLTFSLASGCLLLTQAAVTFMFSPFSMRTITSGPFHKLYNVIVSFPKPDPTAKTKRVETVAKPILVMGNRSSFYFCVAISAISLVLGGVGTLPLLGIGPWKHTAVRLPSYSEATIASTFTLESLPSSLGSMRRLAFDTTRRERESINGEHSATWQFADGQNIVVLSVDFPFPGFHGLQECYVLSGGLLIGPIAEFVENGRSKIAESHLYELRVSKPLTDESYVCYHAFDINGISFPSQNRLALARSQSELRPSYQVQLYIEGCGELNEAQRERYRQILMQASEILLPVIQSMPVD